VADGPSSAHWYVPQCWPNAFQMTARNECSLGCSQTGQANIDVFPESCCQTGPAGNDRGLVVDAADLVYDDQVGCSELLGQCDEEPT